MKKDGIKRLVAFVLCLSLVVGSVTYRPQKANAVALTSTAAVVALVASVMTACGVTYWASTQEDAVSYLGGKIETYLGTFTETYSTFLEWLGINSISDAFAIMNGGIMSVPTAIANKILDFVTWFNQQEGVQSGGNSVGVLGTTNYEFMQTYPGTNQHGSFGVSAISDSRLEITAYGTYASTNWRTTGLFILIPLGAIDPSNIIVSVYDKTGSLGVNKISLGLVKEDNYQWSGGGTTITLGSIVYGSNPAFTASGYDHIAIQLSGQVSAYADSPNEGNVVLELTGIVASTPDSVMVTPSESVVVPAALEEGQSLVVTTTAPIQQGDTQEEACQAILETVVSQDGLTSTITTEGAGAPTSWTWLSDILTEIKGVLDDIWLEISSLPSAIGNAIGTAIQNAVTGISTTVSNIYTFLQNTITGIGQKVDDVKSAVLGLPARIAEAVRGLFVPAEGFVADFVDSLYSSFADRVGVLTYPLAVAESFMLRFLTESVGDPVLTWSAVREPFSNQVLIQAGSFNFNSLLANQQIARVHEILQLVLKAGMAFALFELCRKKYNAIIHGGAS